MTTKLIRPLIVFALTFSACCFVLQESVAQDPEGEQQVLDRAVAATPKMGLNLAGLADWNTELPFVDVFLETREWISQREGSGWGQGPELELDEFGWVKRLDDGCFAEVPLCTIEGGHYPSGVYTVNYQGRGTLEFGNAKVVSEQDGKISIEVDSQSGPFWLRVKSTDPDDYIRDVHIYMPGFGQSSAREKTGIWNPDFLERWRSIAVFRTMDWQTTNNNSIQLWSDRPLPSDASYARRGMPLEIICDFISRVDADLWICVPDDADDDYVRRMADLLSKGVPKEKKIYVEYSNEVWNPSFEQYRRSAAKGRALGFAESDWEAAWRYTARRSVEIFKIFEDVFGDLTRLVRVLPTQAANPYVSEQIVSFEDAWRHADALAIAPYLGMSVPQEEKDEVIALGLDGVLKRVEEDCLSESISMMRRQKELADRYGLELVCYEAGQHLVGLYVANDSEELNSLLMTANRSERMGQVYRRYYQAWAEIGGGTLCHFSSVGRWSKWGSWGLIEFADETPEDSPKYKATLEFAKEWNRR